ncbi:MAG: tRNA pseudouridine55 synthase [Bacteroidia bacterium]
MLEKKKFDFAAGEVLLVDKPLEWTSFNVVSKVRGAIRLKKIGHAGTLDPLATGLLILCTGKMTKQINTYQDLPKQYTGTITLGATTASYDLESEPENQQEFSHLTEAEILKTTAQFIGEIEQTPPIFSAVKVDGKRAYKLARAGKEVKIKTRMVTIHGFEITKIDLPNVEFKVDCSKGTYIRSLANDFGASLGVGGYLSALRRTAIGEFRVEDAWELPKLIDEIHEFKRGELSEK